MNRSTTLPPFYVKRPRVAPEAPPVPIDPRTKATLWQPSPNRPRPRFISSQQLVADTLRLVPRLPPDLSCVVGVARSGMLPATILGTALHLPLYALDQERGFVRDIGHGWRLRQRARRNGPVLVIDDTTGSGRSLRMTQRALAKCGGCPVNVSRAILASIYCNPESSLKPDLWAEDLHLPHLLEWNMFNSIVTSVAAFDMDGILCHDTESGGEPGTPRYLPRREPIHIITGRPERDRAATLGWLETWGVQVASLTMGPWEVSPDWERVAEYKAEAVRRFLEAAHERPFGAPMYVESCPQQAQRIATLTGVMVICPTSAEALGPEGCW
jgi:hypothetical protein